MTEKIRIASFDPGVENFAYVVGDYYQTGDITVQCDVVASGILEYTIGREGSALQKNSDIEFLYEAQKFARLFMKTLRPYYLDGEPILEWAAERYMTRGRLVGNTAEFSNLMLGRITAELDPFIGQRLNMYSSGVWKNAFNRSRTGKLDPKDLKGYYMWMNQDPHELDAALIGHYRACEYFDIPQYYKGLVDPVDRCKLCHDIEKVSNTKKIKRRKPRPAFNE